MVNQLGTATPLHNCQLPGTIKSEPYLMVLYGYRHAIYHWKAFDLSFSMLDEIR